mgnify:FL=1
MISKICVRIYKKVIVTIRKYPTRITIYDRIGKGKTNPAGVGRTGKENRGKAKEMENCMLCPRKCGVNRKKGEMGVCGQTAAIKAARAALHMWEEPCISGQNGSGTVFFSGCNLGCIFCQNHNIATGKAGIEISIERLAEIFLELQEKGANNINLVTAGHFVPQVVGALKMAKQQGLYLPVVYNTSSYEKVETLRLLEGYVDIYLPDLKYVDSAISSRYSHAADYFTCASAAIAEMVRQVGEPEFVFERAAGKEGSSAEFLADEKKKISEQQNNMIFDAAEYQERSEAGESLLMRKGVIVRHLVMPDCVEDSKRVISYLLKTYGGQIFISIMNQYTPLPQCREYPELSRRVTEAEYDAVVDYAIELGIENGFIQEGDVAEESFIPEFDGEGIVRKDVDR